MHIILDGMLLSGCFSGVEIAILNLAKALARSGNEQYSLCIPEESHEHDISGRTFRTARKRTPLPGRLGRILWEQISLPILLNKEKPDLLHAPGYIAPLNTKIPTIITVYDLIALNLPALCKPTNRLNYKLMLPPSVRKAAGIIVPSLTTKKDLLARFPAVADRVRVIHLGVNDEFFATWNPQELETIRSTYSLPEKFILFTGRQEPKKNLVRLVEAFHSLKSTGNCNHKLVMAGVQDRDTHAIQHRVRELGLHNEVILTGFLSRKHLAGLYNLADLFVFPSLYEGFGIPPLEAMAAGTPVVASNRASVPEIVGDSAVLIDPVDTNALANAIHNVLTNTELRTLLIETGRKQAKQYTWQKTAEATEQFYKSVIPA
ncbi:MAG: glycosyltransferase family 4 protein [Kiritimatiellae bacterium]|nr:glycosyltransferase family 4 protein [Kiritimatiellia bacterium]